MALNFDHYATQGNAFLRELAEELGHPNDLQQVGLVLKAVLHTLRERLTTAESIDLIAQLPMFLKAVYVDSWKNTAKPTKLKSADEFADAVERCQAHLGESRFDWDLPTAEIVRITLGLIRERYISDGEIADIQAQLPQGLKAALFA